jgi:pimeloyl-ACP methyl ester carboxylesterase
LIWQHGLFSSGGIWNRMRSWVEPQFSDNPVVESLNSTDRVENQATDLIVRLEARGLPAGIVIGHSQGGLVGRRVAQRRPDLVSGVLTVGTPNRGALLALRTRTVVSTGLTALTDNLWLDCTGPDMDMGCAVAWTIRGLMANALVAYAADAAVPASADLLPQDYVSNPFLQSLNATTETFVRAGIQSYANKRWALIRQAGDFQCYPEDPGCGGRAWATFAGRAYAAFRVCAVIAAITLNENSFFWCTYIYKGMDAVDGFWTRMTTTKLDRTDGVVQGSSQIYPSAMRQFPILGGDSHAGEPNSNLVRDQIVIALRDLFRVPQ